MKTVAVVSDKLLIITGIRPEQLYEVKAYLKDKGHELELIGFPENFDILDLRDAPPAVRGAARLVQDYLDQAEARNGSQSDPQA